MDTWHFLSPPPHSICLWYTFFSPHRHNESRILSFLTQAGGVKGGMSLTLPFSSTIACAQTLEQVALRVGFSPGIPDPVGGQRILVVTAIYESCMRGINEKKRLTGQMWHTW